MALHGTRPASEKLLDAIQQYFEASAREMSFVLGAQVVREWRNSDSQRGER